MNRIRDYKEEYRRRLAQGRARGMSRAQSRGHPRKGEPHLSSPEALPKSDTKVELAIKLMRDGSSMTNAAKHVRISPKRLSRFIKAHQLAKFEKRNWSWRDQRKRRVPIIVEGRQRPIIVEGFEPASRVGKYYNAVHRYLDSNDPVHLEPFIGENVEDVRGRSYEFETDGNTLYRFADRDEPAFHEIYKVVAT